MVCLSLIIFLAFLQPIAIGATTLFRNITCWPVVTNASIEDGSVYCSKGNNFSSTCFFNCKYGYGDINHFSLQMFCSDYNGDNVGEWDEEVPTCNELFCTDFLTLPIALPHSCTNGNKYESICTFTCASGINEIACRNIGVKTHEMKWELVTSECDQAACPTIPVTSNLEFECSMSNVFSSECTFSCANGARISHNDHIFCISLDSSGKGSWSPEPPHCYDDPSSCPIWNTKDYSLTPNCTNFNHVDSICSFDCGTGFSNIGPAYLECIDEDGDGKGKWTDAASPQCQELQCFDLYTVITPAMCTRENIWSSICVFECPEDMTDADGKKAYNMLQCVDDRDPDYDVNGTWIITQENCYVTNCPELDPNLLSPSLTWTCKSKYNLWGAQCNFQCSGGREMSNSGFVFCFDANIDGKGEWTEIPYCIGDPILCKPMLDSVNHGSLSCTDTNNKGSVCTYTCNIGYYVDGNSSVACEDLDDNRIGEWSNDPPACKAVTCTTLDLSGFASELSMSCSNSTQWNSECTFSCPSGMKLDSVTNKLICQDEDGNGEWSSSIPDCIDILCPALDPSTLSPETSYSCLEENRGNSVCTFDCASGFKLNNGVTDVTCQDLDGDGNGEWSGEIPNCKEVTCDAVNSSSLSSEISFTCTNAYNEGSECTFRCEDGMKLDGDVEKITCQDLDDDGNGNWSHTYPNCVAITCSPIDTSSLPEETSLSCTGSNQGNSICTFACSSGMKLRGGVSSITCQDLDGDGIGEWSAPTPDCVAITCDVLDESSFSSSTSIACTNSNKGNSECTFSCSSGMKLNSEISVITCQDIDGDGNGNWSSKIPDCIPILCTALDLSAFANETTVTCTDSNKGNSECTFSCAPGFKLEGGVNVITCEDNDNDGSGEWSAASSNCIAITCPAINTSSLAEETSFTCTSSNVSNSECSFSCASGTKLSEAASKIVCQDSDGDGNGEWNDTIPDCVVVTCPDINTSSLAEETSFICTKFNQVNSECNFSCASGMKISEETNTITCQDSDGDGSGEWSGAVPDCVVITCPAIEASTLAEETSFSCTNFNQVNSECTFSCSTGMKLSSNVNVINCLDTDGDGNGEWSELIPDCVAVTCPVLDRSSLSSALSINCTSGNKGNSICTFACSAGYKLDGDADSSITCQDLDGDGKGEWSMKAYDCVDAACDVLELSSFSDGTILNCSDASQENSECTFKCPHGKKLNSNVSAVTCEDIDGDGILEWNYEIPDCIDITCSNLNESTDVAVDVSLRCTNEFKLETSCYFTCADGKRLDKYVELYCNDIDEDGVGEWSEDPPTCISITCDEFNASSLSPKTLFHCTESNLLNSKCRFECPERMFLSGNASSITCQDLDYDGHAEWSSDIPDCLDISCEEFNQSTLSPETAFSCNKSHCKFRCPHGMRLHNDVDVLTCEDKDGDKKGEWSSEIPNCILIYCPELNSSSVSTETSFTCSASNKSDSECTFTCSDGKHIKGGANKITCQDVDNGGIGKWNSTIPECETTTCPQFNISSSEGLSLTCTKNNIWSSKCTFYCEEGKWLDDDMSSVTCEDLDKDGKGEWNMEVPECTPILCHPEYKFLQNGTINCTNSNYYGSLCNFTCNLGYILIDAYNLASCDDTDKDGEGEWNMTFPSCEVVPSDKVETDCIPFPPPANGNVSCTDGALVGSVCTYTCDKDFALFGKRQIECLEISETEFTWSHIYPICGISLGECKPAHKDPKHGNVTCTGDAHVTSVCTFSCKEGYHLVGSASTSCEDVDFDKVGKWSKPAPICFPDVVKCLPPFDSLSDGTVSCTNDNIKLSVCSFSCSLGFFLIGSTTSTCTDTNEDGEGEWDSGSPICQVITCKEVNPSLLSPETSFTCTPMKQGNSKCMFECPEGLKLDKGISDITCRDSDGDGKGEWSDAIPNCIDITCSDSSKESISAETIKKCSNNNVKDSVCTFSCPEGMHLNGLEDTITCQDIDGDGIAEWNKDLPSCVAILCPPLDESTLTDETTFSCTKSNLAFSKCDFSCPTGFHLDGGAPTITCQDSNGEWSDEIPDCIAVICEDVDSSELSSETTYTCTNGNLGNSECTFQCPSEMRLSTDHSVITCTDSNVDGIGKWSGRIPECVYTCDPMENPTNGHSYCDKANRVGSKCSFECDSGYVLSNVRLVFCEGKGPGGTGLWSEKGPTCNSVAISCPRLDWMKFNEGTQYNCTNGHKRNSKCDFRCPKDMKLSNRVSSISCHDWNADGIGEWSSTVPNCIRTVCKLDDIQIKNGAVRCSLQNRIGSFCSVTCDSGFTSESAGYVYCNKDGKWNSSIPECVTINCLPKLQDLFGSDATCYGGNRRGAECTVKCSHKSKSFGKTMKYVCAVPELHNGGGFWSDDILSCAGCGTGYLDIIVLFDGSANVQTWDFLDMREWVKTVIGEIGGSITAGVTWVSLAVAGTGDSKCVSSTSSNDVKLELIFNYYNSELIKRKLLSIQSTGGCPNLGSAVKESADHLYSRQRPYSTPVLVVLLGGKPNDDFYNAVKTVNKTDFEVLLVGIGDASISYLKTRFETPFLVPSSNVLGQMTTSFIKTLMKIDCKDTSQCSGVIDNGTATCKVDGSMREICTVFCDEGFQLIGNATALCGDLNDDGRTEWITPAATCKKIYCPVRARPKNSFMACSNNNSFASLCKFWCPDNSFLVGQSESFCGDPDRDGVGEWNSNTPTCEKTLYCQPELSFPEFGKINCSNANVFGSLCKFTCNSGYSMKGSGFVRCEVSSSGVVEWNHPPPVCKGCTSKACQKDVVLVIDGSGSIRPDEFTKAKDWVLSLLDGFKGEIDTGSTRVGVIQYSGKAVFMCSSGSINPKYTIELDLGRYSFQEVHKKVSTIGHLRGCTKTGDAITRATQHFEALGRPGVEKVLLVITDGKSNDEVKTASDEAEMKGIKLIAVAVGKFDSELLNRISGRIISVSNYSDMMSVIKTVQKEIQIERDDTKFISSGMQIRHYEIFFVISVILLSLLLCKFQL